MPFFLVDFVNVTYFVYRYFRKYKQKNKLSFLLNKYQINREYGQDESWKSKNNNNE